GIAESVHGALGRGHPLARFEVAGFAVDRIPEHAVEDVDALLVVRMTVGRRHFGSGRNLHFENAQPALLRSIHEVTDFERSYRDDLAIHWRSPSLVDERPV